MPQVRRCHLLAPGSEINRPVAEIDGSWQAKLTEGSTHKPPVSLCCVPGTEWSWLGVKYGYLPGELSLGCPCEHGGMQPPWCARGGVGHSLAELGGVGPWIGFSAGQALVGWGRWERSSRQKKWQHAGSWSLEVAQCGRELREQSLRKRGSGGEKTSKLPHRRQNARDVPTLGPNAAAGGGWPKGRADPGQPVS